MTKDLRSLLDDDDVSLDSEATTEIVMAPSDEATIMPMIQQAPPDLMAKILLRLGSKEQVDHAFKTMNEELFRKIKAVELSQYETSVTTGPLEPSEVDMAAVGSQTYVRHLAMSTPLRLTYNERAMLRLLEATLDVSEYTDKIDVISSGHHSRKMKAEIQAICSILSGMVVSNNYEAGKKLLLHQSFEENGPVFANFFEIGRRYKILNPERMQSSYGKLMYFLMDSCKYDVRQLLGFDCIDEIRTVEKLLKEKNALQLLEDKLLPTAIRDIDPIGKSRSEVDAEIRRKNDAVQELAKKYASHGHRAQNRRRHGILAGLKLPFMGKEKEEPPPSEGSTPADSGASVDEIEQVIYSLSDHMVFLKYNREPVEKMIAYLRHYFKETEVEKDFSLAISAGREGARLTHDHSRQYMYVWQSLSIWREVLHEMIHLWTLADADLLSSGGYRLCDTGQGLNRLQAAPRVYAMMQRVIDRAQKTVGKWVGSSAVHMGDHNVPNALMFIDKYIQVPKILSPLVRCLDQIPELAKKSANLKAYIEADFGGVEKLRKIILKDFFRHAFDGSGADNFYDAGSCIDGRLTSAWNWCNTIEKKPFFTVLLMTGFQGFDVGSK